ncbi:carbohydrate-binding protein [Corynebacterium guaraldiae]
MEKLKEQVQALTSDDWQELLNWIVGEERTRREAQPAVEQAQAEIVRELQDAGKLSLPDALTDVEKLPEDAGDVPEWVNPGTDHSAMYREGDIVQYKGRIVRSTHKGLNHWEPGAHGVDEHIWLDITDRSTTQPEEPGTGEVRPFAPGLDVAEGDIVSYEGAHYRVRSAHTTASHWPPDEAHALFEKL